MKITRTPVKNGEVMNLYKFILKNQKGMEISIITYGTTITSWTAQYTYGSYQWHIMFIVL